MTEVVRLFSYGTLQLPDVQKANFGRLLDGRVDALVGFTLGEVEIDDPEVVELSGKARHPVVDASSDPADTVAGMVFDLSSAELEAADSYETSAYERISVTLKSGTQAFVYARAASIQG